MNYNLRSVKLNKLFLFDLILILSLFPGFIAANNLNQGNKAILNNSIKDFRIKLNFEESSNIISGSNDKIILYPENLTFEDQPITEGSISTRQILRLSNGTIALLIGYINKNVLYLGLSQDGWHWSKFKQISESQEQSLLGGRLFELVNGTLGIVFGWGVGFNTSIDIRLLNKDGMLGNQFTIVPLFPSVRYRVEPLLLPNGSLGVIFYYAKTFYITVLNNPPYDWSPKKIITPPSSLVKNISFSDVFSVAITPDNHLALCGIGWEKETGNHQIYLTRMNLQTCQWDGYQILPYKRPISPHMTMKLLSNGFVAVLGSEDDYRMYLSFGTDYNRWTQPTPIFGITEKSFLDEAHRPLIQELPNNSLLVIQTQRFQLSKVFEEYVPLIVIKIIPNSPNLFNKPIILAQPPNQQLKSNANGTSTLSWFVWDTDPYLYKIYRDDTVVQEGSWSNTTPITYTAHSDQFKGEYNFSIWVSDQTGNTNSDYWGNYTVPPLPEVFSALQPTKGSFDILFLSGIFLVTVFTIIGSILFVKRSRS